MVAEFVLLGASFVASLANLGQSLPLILTEFLVHRLHLWCVTINWKDHRLLSVLDPGECANCTFALILYVEVRVRVDSPGNVG